MNKYNFQPAWELPWKSAVTFLAVRGKMVFLSVFFFYFLQRKMTQVLFLCVFIMYLSWQMADYLDPGSTPRFLLYVAAQHFMGEYWVSVNKKLNE